MNVAVVDCTGFAGAEVRIVPLREENGFLPDLDAIASDVWDRIALFWVNYPNNPTGATKYAHRADEQVEIAELNRTLGALLRFVSIASVE